MTLRARIARRALIALLALAALGLSACAHRDLTAPCTASSIWGGAFATVADDGCGLMRPAN